jgi:anti-sigma regulatory factor (Ser/Thr protein kinase)
MAATVELAPDLRSPSAARRFVEQILARWERPTPVGVAILLVSEVVTNAVQHARTNIVMTVRDLGNRVRIETRDSADGCRDHVVRMAGADAERGRGLAIVAALADRWGCDEVRGADGRSRGKVVWFELACPAAC